MTALPLLLVVISAFSHAAWNLLAHARRSSGTLFLRVTAITALIGGVPVIWAELRDPAFPPLVWWLLPLSGFFQALYYFGLARGYRSGDFTVVYPIARALPVLLMAGIDILRGHPPSLQGWAGIMLVFIGCLVMPLESPRQFSLALYRSRALGWALLIAAAIVGYTLVDKIALEALPVSPALAARYEVWEMAAAIPYLWFFLRKERTESAGGESWLMPVVAALLTFLAYWLVLWAYQLCPYASYIVALRQLGIVIGVSAAAALFREPAPLLRICGALVIAGGIACIAICRQ